MSYHGLTRRGFIQLAGAGAALAGLGVAHADPQSADAIWMAGARMAMDRRDVKRARVCAVEALKANPGNRAARTFLLTVP